MPRRAISMRGQRSRVFGLLLNDAKRNAAACSAAMAARTAAFGGASRRSPAAIPAAVCGSPSKHVRASLPAACNRSKVLALVGQTRDDQQRLRYGSDPQMKAIAGLAHFACEQGAQHRAVRQRLPVRLGRGERQEHQGARVARRAEGGNTRADLAHRHEQLVEGQASGHIVKPQSSPNPLLDREKPNPEDSARVQNVSGSQRIGAVTCLPS